MIHIQLFYINLNMTHNSINFQRKLIIYYKAEILISIFIISIIIVTIARNKSVKFINITII